MVHEPGVTVTPGGKPPVISQLVPVTAIADPPLVQVKLPE
jgi:hypothetical protein